MTTLLIATTNPGKKKEFQKLFESFSLEIKSLEDVPDAPDVKETGDTFQENARLKAETLCQLYQLPTLSDDSGLSVAALEGRPGVYSARYAGEEKNDQANLEKVLQELKGLPFEKRTATFHCVLALSIPNKKTRYIDGELKGFIAESPKGNHGFGYDPIFYVPEEERTLAELSQDEKNQMSHRAKAFQQLKAQWPEIVRDLT